MFPLPFYHRFRYLLIGLVFLNSTCCMYAQSEAEASKQPRAGIPFVLKTNLLYAAALLPNVGIEAPLGRWGSVSVYGAFSRWDTKHPHYWSHQVNYVGVEGRRWLNDGTSSRLNGWFAGAYFMGGVYDLRLFADDVDDYGYWSRWSWSTGLSGGYSLALSRRLNVEFSLHAGSFTGQYSAYNRSRCRDCYTERRTGRRHYLGPTGAGVSLIYRIAVPNVPETGSKGKL
jgi:hypothetical protein